MIAARYFACCMVTVMLTCIESRPAFAASCTISSSGVNFGAYDPIDVADTRSTGSIRMACDAPVNANIALSGGGGSTVDRAMSNGSTRLVYNLYADPQRTTIWGDGAGGSQTVPADGTSVDRPVYGSIMARQRVPAGSYADTITLTVTY